MKNLRHSSLHICMNYIYTRFQIISVNIFVKKNIGEKSNFSIECVPYPLFEFKISYWSFTDSGVEDCCTLETKKQ